MATDQPRTPNQLLLLCDLCDWQCQDHLPAIPAVWPVSRFVISAQHIKTWRCNISLKWVITGSGNGLVLVQRQTTYQANNDLVSVRPSRTYLCGTRVRRHFQHDDIIEWKHFPRYWPFVRGIHRSAELWYFLWSEPEQTAEQPIET